MLLGAWPAEWSFGGSQDGLLVFSEAGKVPAMAGGVQGSRWNMTGRTSKKTITRPQGVG
jgi:hypothetical protein